MEKLNLPEYAVRLKKDGDRYLIFDTVRSKFLVLTPEEWVRQHFIEYLHSTLNFPKSLMKIEGGLVYNRMQKRSDILCYDLNGNPLLLVECKRPTVKLTQSVFDQIARYNMTLKVPYLAVTNGLQHIYCRIHHEKKAYTFLPELINFKDI